MERTMSPEERIRRAEEIYQKRRSQIGGVRVTSTTNVPQATKPSYSLFKKMILQIAICLVIYFIFYLIQDTNYIFSDNVLNKTKEVLSYDINFPEIYQQALIFFQNAQDQIEGGKKENNEEQGQNSMEQQNQAQNANPEDNIGGAPAEGTPEAGQTDEETKQQEGLSQMQIDANDIKKKYTFIKPIQGTITSRFGLRNPTTPTVPKNHTGIDIAANTGTVIQAVLDGVVEIASSEGDYGNHLKIVKDDVAIIYAHCSKIYLKQGDVVKQGDKIAEVGATGNVTGPHLHFEFRKQERYVDPDLIMSF